MLCRMLDSVDPLLELSDLIPVINLPPVNSGTPAINNAHFSLFSATFLSKFLDPDCASRKARNDIERPAELGVRLSQHDHIQVGLPLHAGNRRLV
jgi:hypothetical protein